MRVSADRDRRERPRRRIVPYDSQSGVHRIPTARRGLNRPVDFEEVLQRASGLPPPRADIGERRLPRVPMTYVTLSCPPVPLARPTAAAPRWPTWLLAAAIAIAGVAIAISASV